MDYTITVRVRANAPFVDENKLQFQQRVKSVLKEAFAEACGNRYDPEPVLRDTYFEAAFVSVQHADH